VAERIRARGADGAGGWLESACKLTITFRVGILLITVIWLGSENGGDKGFVAAALVVAALASFVPLRFWDRVGPVLVRHPAYLAAELVLATLILLLTGVDSPFFYYTLGTALLGGLVYGRPGAVLFSVMLIGVYAWVLFVRKGFDDVSGSFQAYVMLPALYPVVAAAGAGARGLLDRQAEAETALAEEQRRAATEGERARLARDMHDSLAKTVSGIGFAALALARHIEHDPVSAAAEARRLAADAGQATREAREIIVGLRADAEGTLPLPVSLRAEAERWAAGAGVGLEVAVEDVGELDPASARELEWILREALSNIERHAHASHVAVRLRRLGERVVLTVSDDGDGFEVPERLDDLTQGRHFGVSGMSERAVLGGGELSVESAPGEGCVLSAWLPAAAQERVEAPAAPAAEPPAAEPLSEPPAGAPTRTVPGYTWQ
jgi:signal transduction histidine kinase